MTGDMDMLRSLRDIRMIQDVSKKAALGYFDVEFTMYGCAYLEHGKRFYKISSNSVDIYQFLEESMKRNIYPGNVEVMTYSCPVPVGAKELIANDIKKELAKTLQKNYPKEFLEDLQCFAEKIRTNTAAEYLWEVANELEGMFEEEPLAHFERLMDFCYSCLKLEKEEYLELKNWLAEERRNMTNGFVSKEKMQKTVYGFGYEEQGILKYFSNANRNHAYEKYYAMEQKGAFLLPIYEKTYWYNYTSNPQEITKRFKEEIKEIFSAAYLEFMKRLKNPAEYTDEIAAFAEEIKTRYGEVAYQTAIRYFHHWGYYDIGL